MSRKKIVAGNWKMHKTFPEAMALVTELVASANPDKNIIKIIFPPAPYLSNVSWLTSEREDMFCGAQNCHTHDAGAFTGEISASAIKSCGGRYVLVGHSERRQYFHENSEMLKAKIDAAYRNGLKPVYCVGEVLRERKENKHFDVVALQLNDVISHLNPKQVAELVIAYEPVWAIGTGETATPQQAEEMHGFIRKAITKMFGEQAAENMPILYGGSCNPGNAKELFSCKNVDGGLIGGASLKSVDFAAITNSF